MYGIAACLNNSVVIDLIEPVHVPFIKHPHRIDQLKM